MPRCLLCHHHASITGAMVLLDRRSGEARQGRYTLCQRCYASAARTSRVRRALRRRDAASAAARHN